MLIQQKIYNVRVICPFIMHNNLKVFNCIILIKYHISAFKWNRTKKVFPWNIMWYRLHNQSSVIFPFSLIVKRCSIRRRDLLFEPLTIYLIISHTNLENCVFFFLYICKCKFCVMPVWAIGQVCQMNFMNFQIICTH